MSHWIIAPVLLPALAGALMLLVLRNALDAKRIASLIATALLALLSLWLLAAASTGSPELYRLGDWPAPFGIVMMLDRLSALMVALTSVLALVVLIHVVLTGVDRKGRHFHLLFQFQLMGLNGAFLTADAFNMFVFFEVLLIASYGLLIHGGGGDRLRAGVQYVTVNLFGSTLFLFALATVYGVTGTLNMADIAVRVAALPEGDFGLIRVAAVMMLAVFAIKGALVPFQFWLPVAYPNAPGAVAALFAIMTKVGAYTFLRCSTLMFPPSSPPIGGLIADIALPAGLLTLALGAIGVLGATRTLPRQAAFAAMASMGTVFAVLSVFTPQGTTAALYYMVHSTLATAALFLLADQASRAGATGGRIAALFFAAAIAMAGLPPLSGFPAKLMVLQSLPLFTWAVVLGGTFLMVVGFARAGSDHFWKAPQDNPAPTAALVAPALLILGLAALTIWAGPVTEWLITTAQSLHDPAAYIAANRLQGLRMKRLIPHPLLSLTLFVLWLLLANGISAGSVVMALLLAVALPLLSRPWLARQATVRHLPALAAYILLVLWDIVIANIQVARIILFMPPDRIRSAWIAVPVELTSPEAISLLAGTITMTPGTVTADMTADGRVLLIHSLHAPDPDAVRDDIKARYESRLRRIFEE